MWGYKVHYAVISLGGVSLAEALHPAVKYFCRYISAEEVQHALTECIAHYGIVCSSQHKVPVRSVGTLVAGIFPYLADKYAFTLRIWLQCRSHLPYEAVGKLIWYIEPDTSGTTLRPCIYDTVLTEYELPVRKAVLINIRKIRKAPPWIVSNFTIFVTVEVIPGTIAALFSCLIWPVSTCSLVSSELIEILTVGTRMAEYAVKDDRDTSGGSFLLKLLKCFVPTEYGINI